jgi:hypothetical protein
MFSIFREIAIGEKVKEALSNPLALSEGVALLDLGARASKKVEHWRGAALRKTEKIDSLCSGRGSR